MAVEVTPEAIEVLRRSLELANVPDSWEGGIRLRWVRALGGGSRIEVEFAESPAEGETVVEKDGVRIFMEPSVNELFPDALLTVEPQHDKLTLRPAPPPVLR